MTGEKLTDERSFFKATEAVTPETVKESPSLKSIGKKLAKSWFPKTSEFVENGWKYCTGKKDVREDAFEWIADRTSAYFPILGPKVIGKRLDPKAYKIVENATAKSLSGEFALEHIPAEYGSEKLKYKDRDVWGVQDGYRAYFIADPEKALGKTRYAWLKWRSGFSKEQLKRAVQQYVIMHEEVESAYQKATGKEELSDSDHGKIQAYLLKSLKAFGAEGVYKVGVFIDSHRNDIFGHYIKEHAPEDVLGDIKAAALEPAYAWPG